MKKLIVIGAILLILSTMIGTKLILDEAAIKDALQKIKAKYGAAIAQMVERIYRLETRHFKSVQFLATGSPGMEKHSAKYPYGWASMKPIWDANPQYRPTGFFTMPENVTGKVKTFIKFPSIEAGMFSLAEYLLKYPAGRWYSTLPHEQAKYTASLNSIKPKFVTV